MGRLMNMESIAQQSRMKLQEIGEILRYIDHCICIIYGHYNKTWSLVGSLDKTIYFSQSKHRSRNSMEAKSCDAD